MSLGPPDRVRVDRPAWVSETDAFQLDSDAEDHDGRYDSGYRGLAPSPNPAASFSASPTTARKSSAPTPENLRERLSHAVLHGRSLMISTPCRDKSKRTFHRVFGSLFGASPPSTVAAEAQHPSKASERAAELLQKWRRPETFDRHESSSSLPLDWPSGRMATLHGASPSLEFVGPEAFIFSGPSLKSASTSTLAYSSSILRSDSDNSLDHLSARCKRRKSQAASLPLELIAQIYSNLAPRDFNAARHTCRSWMSASLDRNLLASMLERGGWSSAAHGDLWSQASSISEGNISEEWLLSRRISRECALSGGWTGNGLRFSGPLSPLGQRSLSCMIEAAEVDFTGLKGTINDRGDTKDNGLVFTVSNCGRYLLVAADSVIFIYVLKGPTPQPMTSVVCPRRVLAMSMDASTRRLAVAALLQGRMGIVCDLQHSDVRSAGSGSTSDSNTSARPLSPGDIVESTSGHHTTSRASLFTSRLYPSNDRTTFWEPPRRVWPTVVEHGQPVFSITQQPPAGQFGLQSDLGGQRTERNGQPSSEQLRRSFDAIEVQSGGRTELGNTDDPDNDAYNYINRAWNLHTRGVHPRAQRRPHPTDGFKPVPVETGPRSIYRHLCSDDDPPRSVAICPQRRCVAFGCSAGIELHWVDALTGQDLHRWFPLTAPSDFLYFLNPRPGVDSAHKLRIISSVAHALDRPALRRRSPSAYHTTNAFRTPCDHYRAVPLSDGYHHLFTDPPSQMLHLGSDAPLGGAIKLIRKIAFEPPLPGLLPTAYAAAADLAQGARVVAAFGTTLVLYSVPPDLLAASRAEQKGDSGCACGGGTMCHRGCVCWPWLEWWPEEDRDTRSCCRNRVPWPLSVRGAVLGAVEGLVDVAVNQSTGLTVWGIGEGGRALVWRVDDGVRPVRRTRCAVLGDGRVVSQGGCGDEVDGDGDVVMRDVGAEGGEEDEGLGWGERCAGRTTREAQDGSWYDEHGDAIMLDAPPPGD